ncbi:MAG: V-type ATP synthase subunit A [Candidatus Moranbacteria bacterium]|nr:V-type ATP synthase subunit A [Candidatus Moranbacteria bacterium]
MDTNVQIGTIVRVTGPLVKASGMHNAKMYELVKVSSEKLLGEIVELNGDIASIQVYEDTAGVRPGDIVERTGETMSAELGPGLLESFYDGVQRPLKVIQEKSDSYFIARGIEAPGLDRERKWDFVSRAKEGDVVSGGDVLGVVQETTLIEHRVMVPPYVSGRVGKISSGSFTVLDIVAEIVSEDGQTHKISLMQRWPIRRPRPSQGKQFPKTPLVTGMRILDTLFPVAKGGAAAIPGAFGTGKSVTQQSLAKYCDAQVIVYIGCGERGNEMTEAVTEFPELIDPNSGEPLMKRTILIANTSNMPVAAREASVYTGITIAEYYRDMGYSVALMADSTSRWAEAMREMSGRLEEMPGEEGYPAYLASRTAEFYERAGVVTCLGADKRSGALTVVGAVSPAGGDLSEPVSQATLRVTKVFWGLDASLAYKKHFPSINWLTSYSLYTDNFGEYWANKIAEDFSLLRTLAMDLLQQEAKLLEIVRLVGQEALSNSEKLVLEVSRMLREDFLFQNAFDPGDAYTSPQKQYGILKSILTIYLSGKDVVSSEDFDFLQLRSLSCVKDVSTLKTFSGDDLDGQYDEYQKRAVKELSGLAH